MREGGCGKLTRVGVWGDERGFFGGEGGVKTLRATGLHRLGVPWEGWHAWRRRDDVDIVSTTGGCGGMVRG